MWRSSYIPELQLNFTCWKSIQYIRGKMTLVTKYEKNKQCILLLVIKQKIEIQKETQVQ